MGRDGRERRSVCVLVCETQQKALPRGIVALSALSESRPTTVSYTAEDIHWQPRSTSGFLIMKHSRLQSFPVQIYRGEAARPPWTSAVRFVYREHFAPEL